MRRVKWIVGLLCAAFVCGFCMWRYHVVNTRFPAPIIEKVGGNQEIGYKDGVTIKASNLKSYTAKEIVEKYPDFELVRLHDKNGNIIDSPQDQKNWRYLTVDVTLHNTGNKEVDASCIYVLELGPDSCFTQRRNRYALNPDKEDVPMLPKLKPGESLSLKLPFIEKKSEIPEDMWKNPKKYTYNLFLDYYPKRKTIQLKMS